MERKRGEYFAAASTLSGRSIPKTRIVTVYHRRSETSPWSTTSRRRSSGGDILPGFRLELSELFAELDRTAEEAEECVKRRPMIELR